MKQQNRQFWIILVIVFLGFIGISMPYLIFPSLFLNPEYTILSQDWSNSSRALLLGITLASYPLGQFLGSPILGSLSDDYGRKPLLTLSLLITGVCNLLSGIAIEWQLLSLLIISRFMAGLMEGNIAIARALAADLTTLSKNETFGKINAAASVAFLVGPLLGGLMTDKNLFSGFSASTPFYFIFIFIVSLAGLSQLVLKNSIIKTHRSGQSIWERFNLIKRLSALFSNKRLRFLMITSTLFTLAVDIFYEFSPVYLTVKWALSPTQLIVYNAVLCLALAVGNAWLPSLLSTRVSSRSAIIYSSGGLALFLIGLVTTNSNAFMVLLFALLGLMIGIGGTLVTVKISDSANEAIQGEVMGVQISLRFLGDALICLLGGVLLLLSSKLILLGSALISLTAMVYYAKKEKVPSST